MTPFRIEWNKKYRWVGTNGKEFSSVADQFRINRNSNGIFGNSCLIWICFMTRAGYLVSQHMRGTHYYRTVIGYHGCDEEVAHRVLLGGARLSYSKNQYDWLGQGIYFWEHGPRRALEWAELRAKTSKKIRKPAVIGAYINLGCCFDLLDTHYTNLLGSVYPAFEKTFHERGIPLPENKLHHSEDSLDHILRFLDCAVINWALELLAATEKIEFQTVRCVFSEGISVFPRSKIMKKSHIQIAVRDTDCILGFFRPNLDENPQKELIAKER